MSRNIVVRRMCELELAPDAPRPARKFHWTEGMLESAELAGEVYGLETAD
ncbi:MAG: hypothetical protein QHJ82_08460 [Verrucomicrobiota bacterium]|nr:hypothetical protein [Verrucomicrobiota bacterium]